MSMQNLQAEFVDALLTDETISDLIYPANNISIYQQHVAANLLRALQETYPLIVKLIGNDFFSVTAKAYIQDYPSLSGNLYDYGEYFSDFLSTYQPLRHLIYITEVAKFEWACHCITIAADHEAISVEQLKQFSKEQYPRLQFTLHPASQLIKFHYPILRIIDLCLGDIDEQVDINEGGVNLLILRRYLDISLIPLTSGEFAFLQAIQQHATLREAEETAIIAQRDVNLEVKLPEWISNKIIVDCFLADD